MTALLVDSHCHLDRLELTPFGGMLEGVLDHAREQGVGWFLCVSIDLDNAPTVLQLAESHANVFASVGVHPNEQGIEEPGEETLAELASHPRIVAIGETGLDYFRSEGDLEWQRERFRRHIRAAHKVGKPLIVHSRDAREDTLKVLAETGAAEVGGVMHCFVDDWDTAERALDLGFYISFSGIVTFRSADALREVARRVPLDRLLVETDSPYLAPVPHRGKGNVPGYVRHVAEHIAELRGLPYEALAEQTTENFFRLFSAARRG
ncbi:MAG: TatD family hydrolase [Thiohalomonadaceae bacterium]